EPRPALRGGLRRLGRGGRDPVPAAAAAHPQSRPPPPRALEGARARRVTAGGPCAGLRVVEFAQVLAGPYAGRVLAELGADVIKVEAPGGDLSRRIAPRRDRGQSGLYTWANLGKRNVCLDLGRAEGRAVALDLVRASQVVIENFRPGVADRLGIGWRDVHAAN